MLAQASFDYLKKYFNLEDGALLLDEWNSCCVRKSLDEGTQEFCIGDCYNIYSALASHMEREINIALGDFLPSLLFASSSMRLRIDCLEASLILPPALLTTS